MPMGTTMMMRVLKGLARFGLTLFGALVEDTAGAFTWLVRTIYEGATRRSFASEAAAEAAEVDAQAQAQADRIDAAARHEESAALAERHIAESRALREELQRQARRRDEIRDLSRSHDPVIRSSTWRTDDDEDPEPESGAPAMALA